MPSRPQIVLVSARPIPKCSDPLRTVSLRQNRSKRCGRSEEKRFLHQLETMRQGISRLGRNSISTTLPGGEYSTAFSKRLVSTVDSSQGSVRRTTSCIGEAISSRTSFCLAFDWTFCQVVKTMDSSAVSHI